MTATQRPSAAEVAELLSNTPRLICPCIDIPLASVQVERTDSLELIPSVRKPSGSVSRTNKPILNSSNKRMKDYSGSSGYQTGNNANNVASEATPTTKCSNYAYSPMSGFLQLPHSHNNGKTNTDNPHNHIEIEFPETSRHPLLPSATNNERGSPPPIPLEDARYWQERSSTKNSNHQNNSSSTGSYVPPGYIIVDHTTTSKDACNSKAHNSNNFDTFMPTGTLSM